MLSQNTHPETNTQRIVQTRGVKKTYDAFRENALKLSEEAQELVKLSSHEESLDLYIKAIIEINKIPSFHRNDSDWRLLANCQDKISSIYDNKLANKELSKQFLIEEEKSLQKIKNCTPKDWLGIASAQNNIGLLMEQDLKLDLPFYYKAIEVMQNISTLDRTDNCWRVLAKIETNIALSLPKSKIKIEWFEKAINDWDRVTKKSDDDWLEISDLQYSIAFNQEGQPRLYWAKLALENLMNVLDKEDIAFLHLLAKRQNSIGCYEKDPEVRKDWYLKAIATYKSIPLNKLPEDYWRDFGITQRNLGSVFANENIITLQDYYSSALDSYLKITKKDASVYKKILDIYTELDNFRNDLSVTMEKMEYVYFFAVHLFSNNSYLQQSKIKEIFLIFHRDILKTSDTNLSFLHQSVLQLMELIEASVDQVDYPNQTIKAWLQDTKERALFRKLLTQIRQAYKPCSLLNACGSARNFQVAVANELAIYKARLSNVEQGLSKSEQRLSKVEQENKQLKKRLREEGISFNAQLNLFQSHKEPLSKNTRDQTANSDEHKRLRRSI